MDNSAAFKTKFNEYIDENFNMNAFHLTSSCTELNKGISRVLNKSIISELLYRIDPVGYERLFEQWILEQLANKGAINET